MKFFYYGMGESVGEKECKKQSVGSITHNISLQLEYAV